MKTGLQGLGPVVLWMAFALSLGASGYTYWLEMQGVDTPTVSDAVVRPNGNTKTPAETVSPAVSSYQLYETDSADGNVKAIKAQVLLDPFAPLAVALPPAPKLAPQPVVAPPSAPMLPFLYAGKFEQPASNSHIAQTVVYLTRGTESFAVSPGDALDANYRFVGIEGETLVFMYLPLSTRQTLNIGP